MSENTTTQPAGRHFRNGKPGVGRRFVIGLAAVTILLVGIGIGSAGHTPAPAATPTPAPTVTVTPAAEVVTKEVTPPDCITALDLAADAIGMLSESPKLASEGITAAFNRDAPAIEAVTVKVQDLNTRINNAAPALGTATQSCRASAK
jgi:hypothetical protein